MNSSVIRDLIPLQLDTNFIFGTLALEVPYEANIIKYVCFIFGSIAVFFDSEDVCYTIFPFLNTRRRPVTSSPYSFFSFQ